MISVFNHDMMINVRKPGPEHPRPGDQRGSSCWPRPDQAIIRSPGNRQYLFETLRTFHNANVPGQGTSASAAATATSGLYFASALDASSDGSDKSSSSQGSKRIGRRVTSQRSQGTARKTFYEQARLPRHQEDVAKPGKQIRQGQGGG